MPQPATRWRSVRPAPRHRPRPIWTRSSPWPAGTSPGRRPTRNELDSLAWRRAKSLAQRPAESGQPHHGRTVADDGRGHRPAAGHGGRQPDLAAAVAAAPEGAADSGRGGHAADRRHRRGGGGGGRAAPLAPDRLGGAAGAGGRRAGGGVVRRTPGRGLGLRRARRRPDGPARGDDPPPVGGAVRADAVHRRHRRPGRAQPGPGHRPDAHAARPRRRPLPRPGAGRALPPPRQAGPPRRIPGGRPVTSQLPSYPGDGQPPAPPEEEMTEWHRLHPLSPLVRSGRHLTGLFILLIVLVAFNARKSGSDFISEGVVIAVVLVAGIISWGVTRWRGEPAGLLSRT